MWLNAHPWVKTQADTNGLGTNRFEYSTKINGTDVLLITQAPKKKGVAGTLDSAIIEFGDTVDIAVLQEVFGYDPDNCYPYIVVVPADKEDYVRQNCDAFSNRLLINPTPRQMLVAFSITKGFSKGQRGKRSGDLDNHIVSAIQTFVNTEIDRNLSVFKPTGKGVNNEDLRITNKNGKMLFSGEGKSISQGLNITERFGMVAGKAQQSHGVLYDLFWSLPGSQVRWLDLLHKSPKHHAKAYVEFTPEEQKSILNGNTDIILNKVVMEPIDVYDLSNMGLQEGPTIKTYISEVLNRNSSQ